MENKNVLIGAVLIILVALLAFNLDITGQATKGAMTSISVSPTTIRAGDSLSVSIIPGSNGAEEKLYIYAQDEDGNLMRKEDGFNYCRGSGATCTKAVTFSYLTYESWIPGTYFAQINDKSGKAALAEFTIIA